METTVTTVDTLLRSPTLGSTTDMRTHPVCSESSLCFLQTVSCGCSQLSVEGGMDAHKQAHFWKSQGSSGVVLDLRLPDGPPDPSSAGVAVQGTSTQTSSSLRVNLMSCFLRARLPVSPPHFLSQISSTEILACLILSWRVFLRGLGLTQYATWMSHFICQQTLWMVMLPG